MSGIDQIGRCTEFSTPKFNYLKMKDQLQKAVETFELCEGAKILELVTSPVQKRLHVTNKDYEKLTNEKKRCVIW